MVSVTIARLFHVFTFEPKIDQAGKAIPIDDVPLETAVRYVFLTTLFVPFCADRLLFQQCCLYIRHPKPFVCNINPRGPTAVALIRAVSED